MGLLNDALRDFRRCTAGELLLFTAGPASASVPRSSHLKSTWPVGQHFEVDVSFRMNASPFASSMHDSRMTTRSKFPSLRMSFVNNQAVKGRGKKKRGKAISWVGIEH